MCCNSRKVARVLVVLAGFGGAEVLGEGLIVKNIWPGRIRRSLIGFATQTG